MENVCEKRIKVIEEMIKIQSRSGTYDYDPYMHGMANGMIYIHSILTDKEPEYLNAPDIWLKDVKEEGILETEPFEHISQTATKKIGW